LPTVSICVPAHNAARYLSAAIDSALAQQYGDFELVVLDNASTDETRAVCERYKDPRFRYEFEPQAGQSIAWNRCLELAQGKYVILLHADDELRPEYLTRAVEVLDANDHIALLHCAAEHIDENGAPLRVQRLFDADLVDRDGVILRTLLLEGCVINPAGVLVRREAYEAVGEFTDKVVWGVDWHMWIRIAMGWPVAYLAEPLARYRQHGASGTSGVMTSARNGSDERWVIDDVFRIAKARRPDLLDLRRGARSGVAERTWWMAEWMCQLGEMRAARTGLRRAISLRPALATAPRTWVLWAATHVGYERFSGGRRLKARVSRAVNRPRASEREDGERPA
jgi:glycosyltransferase involved in cell wall biosynthesis